MADDAVTAAAAAQHKPLLVDAIEVAIAEDKVALIFEIDLAGLRPQAVCVMTPREAHYLRSRLHKAANDASSAAARRKAPA